MKFNRAPHINQLWADLMVEELTRLGVDYFCLSSGSRSAPLAVAVAENKKAHTTIHCDERASGFHAIGYASATQKPATIITTSGTAVANLLPAVVEASKKKIPLIILTADRPPELRFTGANQTIDQVKIFGAYARWFFDMPTPTKNIEPNFILTTIDQAVFQAQGELKGPVHLNCMFREPLAPIKTKTAFTDYLNPIAAWAKTKDPLTKHHKSAQAFLPNDLSNIIAKINQSKNGIIVVGKIANQEEEKAVVKLSEKLKWPIFADIASGLRLGQTHPNVITYFDQILLSKKITKSLKPETIIHLGGRMTSKRFYEYMETAKPKNYITVLNHPLRNDPLHCVTERVQSSIGTFCKTVLPKIKIKKSNQSLKALTKANALTHTLIGDFLNKTDDTTEIALARTISQTINKNHNLFMSNSLIIREMDSFADGYSAPVATNANRGANGIDGIIASACGYTNGSDKRTTLVIGDLAALYDLNALTMVAATKKPMTIIIFNNNGGGIFSFLPIGAYKQFEKYFGTPHNLDFKNAAKMFKINYSQPKTNDDFYMSYKKALKSNRSTMIEVQTDRTNNVQVFEKWKRYLTKVI